jgi:hypothetical protein
MTLWALVLVIVGLALSIYGGNARLAVRLDEAPGRGGRATAAMSRFTLRLGLGLLLLGIALFAISVVIHTVIVVFTIVVIGAIIVGLFSVFGRFRRPRVH